MIPRQPRNLFFIVDNKQSLGNGVDILYVVMGLCYKQRGQQVSLEGIYSVERMMLKRMNGYILPRCVLTANISYINGP